VLFSLFSQYLFFFLSIRTKLLQDESSLEAAVGTKGWNPSITDDDYLSKLLKPKFTQTLKSGTFAEHYRDRYGKNPPSLFTKWQSLARNLTCDTDLALYDQVIRDLSHYTPKSILADQSTTFTSEMVTGTFTNGKFASEHGHLNALFDQWSESLVDFNFTLLVMPFIWVEWYLPRILIKNVEN
jgi:hypothetical protein